MKIGMSMLKVYIGGQKHNISLSFFIIIIIILISQNSISILSILNSSLYQIVPFVLKDTIINRKSGQVGEYHGASLSLGKLREYIQAQSSGCVWPTSVIVIHNTISRGRIRWSLLHSLSGPRFTSKTLSLGRYISRIFIQPRGSRERQTRLILQS